MQGDWEKLALPLEATEEDPGRGENLRYDVLYDQIKEAREEEDASLSQGVWERDLKRADWPLVYSLCTQALETRTKDLQIVVWWGEAACHLENWEGLLKAFTLMRRFCEACWDFCYPILEDPSADLEYRLRILEWFLEKMVSCTLFMPLTPTESATSQPLTLAMWMMAMNLDQVARRTGNHQEEDSEAMTLKKFRSLAQQAPVKGLRKVLAEVQAIMEQAQGLLEFLREKCQGQEPSFKVVMDPLSEVEKICRAALAGRETESSLPAETVSAERVSEAPVETFEEASPSQDVQSFADETQEAEPATPPGNDEVTISGRQDAYKAIEDLAHFLIEIDPQSPGPYLIKLVASWNGKTLPDILDDVASGTTEGHKILKLLASMTSKN